MKHNLITNPLTVLTQSELKNLTIEVKETLANTSHEMVIKKFTSAELWKIQSRVKSFSRRTLIRSY
ncbi:MAG: hypothetical protein ABI204_01200 [Ginsengibacter sp.]